MQGCKHSDVVSRLYTMSPVTPTPLLSILNGIRPTYLVAKKIIESGIRLVEGAQQDALNEMMGRA